LDLVEVGYWTHCVERRNPVTTALIIILIALLLGGVGLAVEALRWLLIIALVLFVVGAITGRRGRAV
jgi:nitrate/nitrite transporter NarK